ncbi:conserved membrane hypothetical protein [Gammaproteobacteria bacterium]
MKKTILHFILGFNFFFPTFNVIFGDPRPGFMILNIITLLCIVFSFLIIKPIFDNLSIAFLLFCILWSFVIIFDIFLNGLLGFDVFIRDLFELYRPVLYYASFLFGYSLYKTNQNILSSLKLVILFSFVTILFSFVCYIFFDQFGKQLLLFYTKEQNINARRLTGTFNNPYDFSYIIILPFAYYYLKFIIQGGVLYALVMMLCLISILFSQSKAGIISLISAGFLVFALVPFMFRLKSLGALSYFRFWIAPFFIMFLFSLILILYGDQITYLIDGLLAISEGTDSSTNTRLHQIQYVIDSISDNSIYIFFGYGPNKQDVDILENLFLLYFYRYGLFGILLILVWIFYPVIVLIKILRETIDVENKIIFLGCMIWFLCLIPSGLANNTVDQARISFAYFFIAGVILHFGRNSSARIVNLSGTNTSQ